MAVSGIFHLGQVVKHRFYGYRGVIIDVDPGLELSEDRHDQVTRSGPPRHKPWFRILVHYTC